MTKIIGFAGQKGSGKDLCCKIWGMLSLHQFGFTQIQISNEGELIIQNEHQRKILDLNNIKPAICQKYAFADSLKEICSNIFGLDPQKMWGTQADKDTLTHLDWKDMPGVIHRKDIYQSFKGHCSRKFSKLAWERLDFYYHPPGLMSYRELLQYMGTNIFRKIYYDCWLNSILQKIEREQPFYAFISDCRFLNEIRGIQKAKGTVVGLTKTTDRDNHESEEVPLSKCDYVIDNHTCENVKDLLRLLEKQFQGKEILNI